MNGHNLPLMDLLLLDPTPFLAEIKYDGITF